jgi:hypothetical protein
MDDIVDLVSRSDDDLRALIAQLEDEERDISRRRRILHGELDILRAELVMRLQRKHAEGESIISADDVAGLSEILAGKVPGLSLKQTPSLPTKRNRSSVFCPECGIRNSEGASFCVRCGASLIADQPESATTLSYVPGEEDGEITPFAACADDACLVIRSGGGRAGETYVLHDARVSIGRHPDAKIFLDDVTVSRNHAVVEREGDQWVIVDEGSLNGTFINRRRGDRTVLSDGDEIQIGKYKFTFLAPAGS